ncbi:hypothetical protein Tco_0907430, partial [Tanacetum coccineum]
GFAAVLAVLITGASQSRQHDTLVRLPIDIRLKIDLGKSVVYGVIFEMSDLNVSGPGEIKLFLVAFDSQLKVFHPLKNGNMSGKHPQSHVQVKKAISFQIGELLLNKEEKHVFNVTPVKSWEVSFYELVK